MNQENYSRRKSYQAMIGPVAVGGNAPVMVQSMTNTDTADITATVAQVRALAEAGSEVVRITVNNEASAQAVPEICAQVSVPIEIGRAHV